MAIYHCSIKIIGRSDGKSAVASSAYRSGKKLMDDRTGLIHNFTKKCGVVFTEVSLPAHASPEYADRNVLWNAVEKAEKKSNAQLAREIEVALPKELSRKCQIEIVRRYVQNNFVSVGMCADWALHDKGDGNPHAHIMLTMRGIKPDGSWAQKEKKIYALDEDGNRIPLIDPATGEQKLGKRNEKLWKRITVEPNDWNDHSKAEIWRKSWADICNEYLSLEQQIDHRSYKRQELDLEPTIHEGYRAHKMEKAGFVSNRCEYNRIVRKLNELKGRWLLVVSQMWIRGELYFRRPDLILFVNGLPLVFIELKNSDVKLKTAYDKNLKDYIRDIPQLFFFNQFCVLSNAKETRIGSFTAGYEHFFEWLRLIEEDKVDRKEIRKEGTSLEYLIDGLFSHDELLDYIENFILYENKREKIIGKNHQYLGVNKAIENFKRRDELDGKLGVFWHTQGSGKSYSMGMYVNKINRKVPGNFTFLLVTDRVDLDGQLYKNFLRTEIITEDESAQPRNSKELREDLKTNKPFVFTLIHKFGYEKGKEYPILSQRDDIVVIVDEAHRTQYKDLAQNMRTGIPNAQYIAFTGTPLLGSKRLTNQWFGDYVSEYNFARSIEDGSTVPLYYSRRVPEVELVNTDLDDDYLEIIENENLTPEEEEKLERNYARTNEVLKRDERLDKVAKDIVEHFPRRGYLGKAMVVSVDKFTAVKMYEKVQHYWDKKLKELYEERSANKSKEEKADIKKKIDYMKDVEMVVVISQDDDEERFTKYGLDIKKHRERINHIDANGHDIEDNFKDPNHPLSLVFICAMWLTGFDAPSVSTLYLDKPMKGHTLMQAIARVNRVYPGKNSGLIVDYLNLFKSMKRALGDYANPDNEDEMPVKNIEAMLDLLDQTIDETYKFCKKLSIDFDKILEIDEAFSRISLFEEYLNILLDKDDYKEEFKIYTNLCRNIYEGSKPEVFEKRWNNKYLTIIFYLDDMFKAAVRDVNIDRAKIELDKTLDLSVKANSVKEDGSEEYGIKAMKTISLAEINTEDIKRKIQESPYKNIEIQELRSFIEEKLEKLLQENKTRISFSERYKAIIDKYNSGNSSNENYYEDLIDFVDDLKEEDERNIKEGLTEEELELYDLLRKDNLTKKEEEQVKLSAKKLYEAIMREDSETKIVDWYKDEQPRRKVKLRVEKILDDFLPESYSRDIFTRKSEVVFTHLLEDAMMGSQRYVS